jgi:hypothetical protein
VFIDSDEQGYVNSYRSGKLTAGFEIWRGESHDGDLVRAHGSHVFPPTDKKLSKNERKQSVRRYIESLINDSIKSPDEKDTLMSEQRTALVLAAPAKPDLTFSQFVEQKYYTFKGTWHAPTRINREQMVKTYLFPKFGNILIRELDGHMLQTHLNQLGRSHTSEVVNQVKNLLKQIMHLAFRWHYIDEEIAGELESPIAWVVHPKGVLGEVVVANFLSKVVDAESRCAIRLGIFSTPRGSELFGLRWNSWDRPYIKVSSIAYRGKFYVDETKTPDSGNPVYVPYLIHPWIEAYRAICPDTSPEALMFPFIPLARDAGIPEHECNFRAFRRAGGNQFYDTAVVELTRMRMRQANAQTTTEWYLDSDENRIREIADLWCRRILDLMERLP